MATVRKGNKKALLVVDVQVGVMQDLWESQRVIKNIVTVRRKGKSPRCAGCLGSAWA